MSEVTDVVVVGGGIGGASLAYALAREGVGVTVLEASIEYEDRVRGESMHLWGVKEARDLGVEQIMLDAGAHIAPVWKQYVEGIGEAGEIPMSMFLEGFDGTLNLRHPDACQALVDAAASAGARIVRGVRNVKLSGGRSSEVSYDVPDGSSELRAGLVVGADGRASVVRKQSGITLDRQEPISYIAGLLVEGLDDIPDHDCLIGEGDALVALFQQGTGRGRVYVMPGLSGQHRFSGPNGTAAFLEACARSCFPWAEVLASSTPIGPCATYPGDDTWTATPFAEGVVLIGDAAGHNDPVIGQGLSIALRDARMVRDVVLAGGRTPDAFAGYGDERFERMRRLRFLADVIAVAHAEDADNRAARRAYMAEHGSDPEVMSLFFGMFVGPETVPAELIDDSFLARIRAA